MLYLLFIPFIGISLTTGVCWKPMRRIICWEMSLFMDTVAVIGFIIWLWLKIPFCDLLGLLIIFWKRVFGNRTWDMLYSQQFLVCWKYSGALFGISSGLKTNIWIIVVNLELLEIFQLHLLSKFRMCFNGKRYLWTPFCFRENDLNRLESLMDGKIEDEEINRKPKKFAFPRFNLKDN